MTGDKLIIKKRDMKRFGLLMVLGMVGMSALAVPARPGIWKLLQLKDGTEVRAQLKGDEFRHSWVAADGRHYVKVGDGYERLDEKMIGRRGASRRAAAEASVKARRVTPGSHTHFTGKKKGVVILAEFADVSFKSGNTREKYEKILNTEGYTSNEGFKGSVADYFEAQSGGQFEVEFDVFGPVKLKHERSYYGENDEEGSDMRVEEMIVEACRGVNSQANFSDYDWDGDGEVDEVYVVYANKAEADGGGENTIWPHMYALEWTNTDIYLDGVRINTYACSNELDYNGKITGIGSFCHEFSHCLGYVDLYDTVNDTEVTFGSYDLMDSGCYNGNSFKPAGYSAYEKWMAGWIELTELSNKDVVVKGLAPVSEGGGGYIIYNDGHRDEYFILENRQQTNWDAHIPGVGLMITHVDFDPTIWELNIPNSILDKTSYYVTTYYYPTNDHCRLNLVRADNSTKSSYNSMKNDLYPYESRDSLTATSKPAAKFFNVNKQDDKLMHGAVLHITQNRDGTMDFVYRSPETDTGIREVQTGMNRTSVIYDLQGRLVTDGVLRKGIYIVDGKKVVKE